MAQYIVQYQDEGYTVIPGFCSKEDVAALKREYVRLVDEMDPNEHRAVFTTGNEQVAKDRGDYFLESGDKIRYFFEKDVFDENGHLKIDKHVALNKVGHALHAYNDVCKRVTFEERVKAVCRALGFRAPAVCQSMFILKQAKVGGEVSIHQDATFLYTEPTEDKLVGFWIALDDCTLENGCLEFVPGSQRQGLINGRRMVRVRADEVPQVDDAPHDSMAPVSTHSNMVPTGAAGSQVRLAFVGGQTTCDGEFVPATCRAGSLVLIHGCVVHRSAANLSDLPRNSYSFHVIETQDCEWSAQNWLQPTEKLGFVRMY